MAAWRPSEFQYFFGTRAKFLYELISWHLKNATDLRFMNYGFDMDPGTPAPILQPEDEAERYCAQLYHAVASQADLRGKRVLDIGSGRGGGAFYVHRYLGTREMVGCDLADRAIAFCHRVYQGIDGLTFRQGDAMNLPFGDNEFDAVLNVESAHCYPDKQTFYKEVRRVLQPGGRFLHADFTPPRTAPLTARDATVANLQKTGFEAVEVTNITPNILRGLERDDDRRSREIRKLFPPGTRRMVKLWAGTRDSWIFQDFKENRRLYLMYSATQPAKPGELTDTPYFNSSSIKLIDTEPALATLCSTPLLRR